jgi:uncharacterized membrane-anchored protein
METTGDVNENSDERDKFNIVVQLSNSVIVWVVFIVIVHLLLSPEINHSLYISPINN